MELLLKWAVSNELINFTNWPIECHRSSVHRWGSAMKILWTKSDLLTPWVQGWGFATNILGATSDLLPLGAEIRICDENLQSKVWSPYPLGAGMGIWDLREKSDLLGHRDVELQQNLGSKVRSLQSVPILNGVVVGAPTPGCGPIRTPVKLVPYPHSRFRLWGWLQVWILYRKSAI